METFFCANGRRVGVDKYTYYQDGYRFLEKKRLGEHRTPRDYPYNFDDYWLWSDPKPEGEIWSADYSDRLSSFAGYSERYREIVEKIKAEKSKPLGQFSREETCRIVEAVYEGRMVAKGLSMSCNQSTGYPILVFHFVEKKS